MNKFLGWLFSVTGYADAYEETIDHLKNTIKHQEDLLDYRMREELQNYEIQDVISVDFRTMKATCIKRSFNYSSNTYHTVVEYQSSNSGILERYLLISAVKHALLVAEFEEYKKTL